MRTENTNLNIPNVTVTQIVEMLSLLYSNAINNGMSLKPFSTPFLWGPAGIGKSEAVKQLAKSLASKTNKQVNVTDVRLLLFSPVDLRGLPVPDTNKQFSNWLMPKIFDMNVNDEYINLLFLDELSAAPQSVQAAAYQICLDRRIGEHKLPDNCIVVAAGNRTTDQSVSFKMPKALCNRLMHFNVVVNYNIWCQWAIDNDIDSRVIGYLAFDNDKLCVEPESSDMAYPTPRSWSFVSNLLKTITGDIEKIHPLISACIGTDVALEFEAWVKNRTDLPAVEDVMKGICTKYPVSPDTLLTFIASLVSAVRANKDTVSVRELENVCVYIKKFPPEFAMTAYTDLNAIEQVRLKLMKCPTCQSWLAQNKHLL